MIMILASLINDSPEDYKMFKKNPIQPRVVL